MITPDKVSDAVRGVLRRNVQRVRNGARHLAGVTVPVGMTPRSPVWRRGRATLWRYEGAQAGEDPPVLIVHSLVSQSYILDLHPGNSYVERMLERGHSVYLLDFGTPDARDAANGLSAYTDEMLPDAAEAAMRDSGAAALRYVGYCFGGNICLMSLATQTDRLRPRSLVTMATPIDLWEMGFVVSMFLEDRLDPGSLLDATGNVPAEVVRRGFKMLKPTADAAQAAMLMENIDDRRFLRGYYAMDQWVREHVPFPGAAFVETVNSILRPNAFIHDGPLIAGQRRPLSAVRCPTLVVMAAEDYVVPIDAAAPLTELLGGHVTELELPFGHVGLVAGRAAATESIPAMLDWLGEH